MPTNDLLPGVTTTSCPPRIACDAHSAIRRARRVAILRDALQISFIAAVDVLFLHFPSTRLPFADRAVSLSILRAINGLIVADVWLTRALPRWSAKRISMTWCRAEREKFETAHTPAAARR